MVAGGVGKNILATAVVRAINKKYPSHNIIVLTPYGFVWKNNPRVSQILNPEEEPDLYGKYIKDHDTIIMFQEPYMSDDFFNRRKHLTEIWCQLCSVSSDRFEPELYYPKKELEEIKKKIGISSSPIFMIQTSGGHESQKYPISWTRDLPLNIAEQVVEKMNQKGYRTVHIRRENQYALPNTLHLDLTTREMIGSVCFADKLLLIDSVAMHAAAAFGKKAVVTWVGNPSTIFGYGMHKNIYTKVPMSFRHFPNAFLDKYDITGNITECPFDTNDLFDADELVNLLDQ